MLHYRLYDIDHIINRTLVYGLLTILLAAGYVATIMALQGIGDLVFQLPFRAVFGQKSTLATIAATLAMAALFNPLRRRIQSFIDRRFYRKKYDARKTLEAFSAQLRDETDLGALSDDLVGVIRETMQPAHVSLWQDRCAFVAGGAFGVHDLPDISSRGEAVPHLDVTYRRFGVIALRAGIAERRWTLAGDLHAAVRHEPLLGHRDGPLARALLAQIGVGGF
jgi:hypothetical protein